MITSVAACTGSSTASLPVLAAPSSLESVNVDDEVAPDEHGGITGVFITDRGIKAMLAGFKLELGDMRLKFQRTAELLSMKTLEADALLKHGKSLEFRAQWGLPIGVGLGVTAAAILIGIAAAIFPQVIKAAAQ